MFDFKGRRIIEYDLNANFFSDLSPEDERLKETMVSTRERMRATFGYANLFFLPVDQSHCFQRHS